MIFPARTERPPESRAGHPSNPQYQRVAGPRSIIRWTAWWTPRRDRYGLRLFAISDIYVREVQTVSNSFAPEFGGTAGDIFNVITNSGSNQFHGEVLFHRPSSDADRARTDSAGRRTRPNPSIDLHDYAFNAGGPIKKDKVFIFGAYEHLLRGTPMPVTIDPTAAAQIGIPPDATGHRAHRAARSVSEPARGLADQLQALRSSSATIISATSIRSIPPTAD